MMRYHLKTNDFLVQCERWERVVDSAHCNIQSMKIHFFSDKKYLLQKGLKFWKLSLGAHLLCTSSSSCLARETERALNFRMKGIFEGCAVFLSSATPK